MTSLTPAALLALIASNLPSTDSKSITAANHRQVLETLLDSGVPTWYFSTVSGTVTLGTSHMVVLVDTSGGAAVINLPDNATYPGRLFFVKNAVGANNATITPAGSDTIEGGATLVLGALDAAIIISDGAGNWVKLN